MKKMIKNANHNVNLLQLLALFEGLPNIFHLYIAI